MADVNQASSGSSPASSQNPPASTTVDWEARSKELERNMQAMSGERARYKQQNDAWMRLANDPRAAGAIKFDPATGLPMDWDLTVETAPPAQVSDPFRELGVDPNAASQWVQQQTQAVIAQQGYITQAQAQTLANQAASQAYQMANHRFSTARAVDKLLADPLYKDLSNPQSDWAKRTANYLQKYEAGQPTREGSSWDEWNFTGPQVLQQAADIAYAQMTREAQAGQVSQNQAIQNQQAAGISAGPTTAQVPITADGAIDKAISTGGMEAGWGEVGKQIEANWQQKGLLK